MTHPIREQESWEHERVITAAFAVVDMLEAIDVQNPQILDLIAAVTELRDAASDDRPRRVPADLLVRGKGAETPPDLTSWLRHYDWCHAEDATSVCYCGLDDALQPVPPL